MEDKTLANGQPAGATNHKRVHIHLVNNGKDLIKRKGNGKVPLKSFFVLMLFYVMIFIEYQFYGSYLDEILGIAALGFLIIFNRKLRKYDVVTFSLLLIIMFIGVVSNLYSGVSVTVKSIGIDAVTQVKVILMFFTLKYFLTDEEKQKTIEMNLPVAKIWCVVTFVCSILTQFFNTGMYSDTRYGIKCFDFVFDFNFEYIAAYLLMFGTIVCSKKISEKSKHWYLFFAIVSIALNAKSEALLFVIVYLFLYFGLKRHGKINILTLGIMFVAIWFISQYQVETYLTTDGTARRTFYQYAVKNANSFFPFGSGFATYGSAEASKNYSPLYYLYNFDEVWGMSPDFRAFLTDTYWASVLGQFGWIGFFIMIIVYLRVFFSFNSGKFKYDQLAFLCAAFAQYVIHAIGSGIITSSPGMIGFMAIALCSQSDVESKKALKLPRIKIKI